MKIKHSAVISNKGYLEKKKQTVNILKSRAVNSVSRGHIALLTHDGVI
jgi:hypothetical protein